MRLQFQRHVISWTGVSLHSVSLSSFISHGSCKRGTWGNYCCYKYCTFTALSLEVWSACVCYLAVEKGNESQCNGCTSLYELLGRAFPPVWGCFPYTEVSWPDSADRGLLAYIKQYSVFTSLFSRFHEKQRESLRNLWLHGNKNLFQNTITEIVRVSAGQNCVVYHFLLLI